MTDKPDPVEQLQAHGLIAIKQSLDLLSEVEKPDILESWHVDLWQHLVSEFFLSHQALVVAYAAKDVSSCAWRTRNLLELTVWVAYCIQSSENAKRFYDDKARDVFEMLDSVKGLAALGDTPDLNLSTLIDETRTRVEEKAKALGYEDIDEAYQRVNNAAQEVGFGPFFGGINKMLSKFAHPTAMMVFSLLDEGDRNRACVIFLVLGMILCMMAMQEFEAYVKKTVSPRV